MGNVLDQCFCLVEDPFDPKVDPRKNFTFTKAKLSATLDIFNIAELDSYFIKIGMFRDAVDRVANFLEGDGYDVATNTNTPAFLIQAPRGAGRSSLANQIAYQVKQYIGGDCALQTVPVVGENDAKLLFLIKKRLETHIQRYGIQDCTSTFTTYPDNLLMSSNGPDLTLLSTIFEELTVCLKGAPPMLLIVEEIDYPKIGWISNLYRMVSPLNVVLIILTSDYRIRKHFEQLMNDGTLTGCWVGLNNLDRQAAIDFMIERLDWFRKEECDAKKLDVFPFDPSVFTQAFKDEDKGVKKLLGLFGRAFTFKLNELNDHPEPENLTLEELLITWEYFDGSFRKVVRETGAKKV